MMFLGEKFSFKYDGTSFLIIAGGVALVTTNSNQDLVEYTDAELTAIMFSSRHLIYTIVTYASTFLALRYMTYFAHKVDEFAVDEVYASDSETVISSIINESDYHSNDRFVQPRGDLSTRELIHML